MAKRLVQTLLTCILSLQFSPSLLLKQGWSRVMTGTAAGHQGAINIFCPYL